MSVGSQEHSSADSYDGVAHTREDSAPTRRVKEEDDPQHIGRFAVIRRLGAGAMGVVYSAYDDDLDRRVAIKVLATDRDEREDRARMLREAQALARVSHPNVVQVYEVGPHANGIFVAMEFISGDTIGSWIEKHPRRTSADVLEIYVQAGAGLAAAHEAGLVHRDFKPENVIVGEDGRVRVLDFGIAAVLGEREALAGTLTRSGRERLIDSDGRLTKTGQFLGTPAYMSPEQMRGLPVEAASDQFGFCVALYETLYGERPYASKNLGELVGNVFAGKVRPPPKGSEVPAWVREVLLRGLKSDPSDRWPSMRALLRELQTDPTIRRKRAVSWALGGGAVATALFAAAWSAGDAPDRCAGARTNIATVWNDTRRDEVGAAMTGTDVTFARDTWSATSEGIERYVSDWVTSFTAACRANAAGEQSANALDLRMACLDRRRRELDALLRQFEQADAAVVANAPTATADLPAIARCDDLDALTSGRLPPPTETERVSIETLRESYDTAQAQFRAGRYDGARKTIDAILPEVRALEYRPFRAEVLHLSGGIYSRSADPRRATDSWREAYYVALAGRHDIVATEIAIWLVISLGTHQALFEQAEPWVREARALLHRIGSPPKREARFLAALGGMRERQGKFDEAEQALLESMRIRTEGGLGELGSVYNALAFVEQGRENYDTAETYFQRAAEAWSEGQGASHPQVSDAYNNLGSVYLRTGRLEDAEKSFKRALKIRKAALGDSNPRVAHLSNNLGSVALERREFDKARGWFEESLAVLERALGKKDPALALVLINIGDLERMRDRPRESLPFYAKALSINEAALGSDHPELSWELTGMGLAHLELDEPAKARGFLERALRLRETGRFEPNRIAQTRFGYAKALLALGERSLAAQAGRKAAEEYAAEPNNRTNVQTWLTENDLAKP